jgi:hypothetical protein
MLSMSRDSGSSSAPHMCAVRKDYRGFALPKAL